MRLVGGDVQGLFVERVRGLDPEQCLLVPVDVGKTTAMALVADLFGQVVVDPFGFDLTEGGVSLLLDLAHNKTPGPSPPSECERGCLHRSRIECA